MSADLRLAIARPALLVFTWLGLAWLGLAWLGLAWPGLAWPGLLVQIALASPKVTRLSRDPGGHPTRLPKTSDDGCSALKCPRVAFVILLCTSGLAACSLTAPQRTSYIQKAIKLITTPASQPAAAQRGPFKVRAYHYYNDSKSDYSQVYRISVHETDNWPSEQTEWNSGRRDEVELRFEKAQVGKYYKVRVEWEDGSTYNSEYQMQQGGTAVRVEEPD
jgi:hypothetical protein